MGKFEDLIVWQKAKDLAVSVYKVTKEEPLSKDFGLKDQLQRSAVSISSNIAEGDESGSNKLSTRYFYITKGSVAELYTQILISNEIDLISECKSISSMLNKLIQVRKSKA